MLASVHNSDLFLATMKYSLPFKFKEQASEKPRRDMLQITDLMSTMKAPKDPYLTDPSKKWKQYRQEMKWEITVWLFALHSSVQLLHTGIMLYKESN